ncbi:hypothetical protein HAX54_051866, partial [Datura stramonium]|nr:hypothetical protein [Datura stramonium]
DALVRITAPLGNLLKIDKEMKIKSRPNFSKVLMEIYLVKIRRDSIWVGLLDEKGL